MATREKKLSAKCIARLSWNQKDTLTFALSHLKQVNFYGLKGPAIWTSSISSNSVRSTDIAVCSEAEGAGRLSPGFQPISAKISGGLTREGPAQVGRSSA